MSRYVRNTAIQLQLESTYGTDPGSWDGTHVLLISNATFDNPQESVARELLRGHMGGFEELNTTGRCNIRCELEFAGSGTAGTAPAWGPAARICGMAETVTASTMVEYTPVSTGFESGAIRYFLDGVMYLVLGVRGTLSVQLNAFGIPKLVLELMGLNATASATATPAGSFTAWKRPLPINEANGGELLIGCGYSGGALTSGTQVASQGLEFMLGHTVQHQLLLNAQAIDITARKASGRGTVYLPAATEVTWHGDMKTNVITSFGFKLGSASGAKVVAYAPAVQRSAVRMQDYQGRIVQAADLLLMPLSANDDLRLVAA